MAVRPKPHPQSIPRRPEGVPTRGKTARNRLRRVDNFLCLYDAPLLRRTDGPFAHAWYVDLGYGAEPFTTLESAARLRRIHPDLPVLGVEIDPARVAAAQPYANALTHFRLGGFNLPIRSWPDGTPETVRLIRAFNVLRQYDEDAVDDAYARLAHSVLPGGLLFEGTSDPFGRIWVANLLRRVATSGGNAARGTWRADALIFSTNFRTGFDPGEFQTVLPKNLIHRVVPGEPIYDFFQDWKTATLTTSVVKTWGVRQWFVASARALSARGYRINTQRKWLRRGWLIWNLT